jgi:hypothetical protein
MQPRRPLSLVLDPHHERSLKTLSSGGNRLGLTAFDDALFRRVPHPELSAVDLGRGDHLEIGLRDEVADLQFSLAHDGQGRGLDPSHANNAARATTQGDGRRAGERQIVDLVGLSSGDSSGIEATVLGVGPGSGKRIADGLRILGRKYHPHHHAAVVIVFQDLLPDELTLAITVGGEPHTLRVSQRGTNRLELGGLVAPGRRLGAVEVLRTQKD